jgi:ADP-ribose pyrophosphatase YjhB (NUDIX family)
MKPDYDIVFDRDKLRFNFRIVGICIDRGRVLLQQVKGTDWWFMPGGRCALDEPARDCLKREMKEELDADAEIGRLVWVVENFFDLNSRSYHELSMFFLVEFVENTRILGENEFTVMDDGAAGGLVPVTSTWHRLEDLENVPLFPAFLRAGLQHLPAGTQHIVQRDN